MNTYWYIWFEVFEDGKKVGSGRYHQAYTYKKNAERRARQMWSADRYSPMTNTIISHKWIISQSNPWDEERRIYDT